MIVNGACRGAVAALSAVLMAASLLAPGAARPAAAATATATLSGPKAMARSANPDYLLTLVARQCATYRDVMANRARNDIQESLQNLGRDTLYTGGQAVSPAVEDRGDPACRPLDGWRFTFGSTFTKPGLLSVVDGASGTAGPTGTAPELDPQGNLTGRTLRGAVTVTLDGVQRWLAESSRLWVQGGAVADPLLKASFGDGAFGFAALRCAQDDDNGDNVESVGYPAGVRHQFCYAYYVSPEPGHGSLTIRKQIQGPSSAHERFTFASNATYNPDGTFDLPVDGGPAEQTFNRATSAAFGGSYAFTERLPAGWTLKDIRCSATSPDGSASSAWQVGGPTVKVTLADRDHVTCVYTDVPPRDPGLVLRKTTYGHRGGGGPFTFFVRKDGDPAPRALTAGTHTEGVSATATGADLTALPPGGYTVTEVAPSSPAGTWELDSVGCDGRPQATLPGNAVHLDLGVNTDADCTFVNRFVPRGFLRLWVVTRGGTGTGSFSAVRTTGPGLPQRIAQAATTTVPDRPRRASGDPSGPLRLEDYQVTAYPPLADRQGSWRLDSFTCRDGHTTRIAANRLLAVLDDRNPGADCTAVYRRVAAATVRVAKVATPQGTGVAVLDVRCADGAHGRAVLASGAKRAALPRPLTAVFPTRCRVTERLSPAARRSVGRTTAAVTENGRRRSLPLSRPGGGAGRPLTSAWFAVAPGRTYAVEVANLYRRGRPPNPACRLAQATARC